MAVVCQAQTLVDTKDSQIADLHQQLAVVNKQFEEEVSLTMTARPGCANAFAIW